MLGIVLICASILGAMGVYSSSLGLGKGHAGAAGEIAARAIRLTFGNAALLLLITLAVLGLGLIFCGMGLLRLSRISGIIILLVSASTAFHAAKVAPGRELSAGALGFGGGMVGAAMCLVLRSVFGLAGIWVVLIACITGGIILLSGWSLRRLGMGITRIIGQILAGLKNAVSYVICKRSDSTHERGDSTILGYPSSTQYCTGDSDIASSLGGDGYELSSCMQETLDLPNRQKKGMPKGVISTTGTIKSDTALPGGHYADPESVESVKVLGVNQGSSDSECETPGGSASSPAVQSGMGMRTKFANGEGKKDGGDVAGDDGEYVQITLGSNVLYELPPITLLRGGSGAGGGGRARKKKDDKGLVARANLLVETLESFGVSVTLTDIKVGPAVTRFEVHPARGVKVVQVSRLADDIALALAAPEIRIEAPIPGKSAIGIEVPNLETSLVCLRDVIETKSFSELNSALPLALGKDIAGNPVVAGLDRMLHLLIAGATGSGKSVCINSIITGLLLTTQPDEVKFLLIDPKVVELSVYNGIPHLISPVVTAPKKAASALRWVVNEMMRRYEAFGEAGVRDISTYNEWVKSPGSPDAKRLPYIVVVIDELSDLMMVSPVEVEDCIFRLAQMARAAGIHLVVATQRPSTDVITGTIKANIPSRIAFAVSSHVDSKTILDMTGAEKLIGGGDMLFLPVWATKPVRVQGAYVSDREVEKVVAFASRQSQPEFETNITAVPEEDVAGSQAEDELFEKALGIVVEQGQASVSLLQRKLRVGYSRAGRLIDSMEEKSYIGPYEGSKPREVKISWDEYVRLFPLKSEEPPGKA